MNNTFWPGKRVFLTGHTGFKGSWLSLWLKKMGAEVKGYSKIPETQPSLFEIANIEKEIETEFSDIRDYERLKKSISNFNPEIVIHMAAQPLVRDSYKDPLATYTTNIIGTANLLEAARHCQTVRVVINVTTDKCYQNEEWQWGYRESDALGGRDPYSSSKACSELITTAYRESFFKTRSEIHVATARAGNVIGGGDWSKDRLVPDILRAFSNRQPVTVRNPLATRPWQHVLEPLHGYLTLAEHLDSGAEQYQGGWNFGPAENGNRSVKEIIDLLVRMWPESASWVEDHSPQPKEAGLLKLDISKAKALLNWHPIWKLETGLQSIVDWHQSWLQGNDMKEITLDQINQFEASLNAEKDKLRNAGSSDQITPQHD